MWIHSFQEIEKIKDRIRCRIWRLQFVKCQLKQHPFTTCRVKRTLDNWRFDTVILHDLQKAFDIVIHKILLLKLEHNDVCDCVLERLRSWLSNRSQYVYGNGNNSNILPITYSVPQGSILSSLYFIIYISDLPNAYKMIDFYLFANDTNYLQ